MCMKKLFLLFLLIPTIKADWVNFITYSMDVQILDRKVKTLKIKNYCINGVKWMHITEQGKRFDSKEETLSFTKAQLPRGSDIICEQLSKEDWEAKY